MAELALAGINLGTLDPLREQVLLERIDRRNTLKLLQVAALVTGMRELAAAMGGKHDFKSTQNLLAQMQSLMFPDEKQTKEDLKDKARRVLEKEFSRGPLKVKALDYGKKRRRKRG